MSPSLRSGAVLAFLVGALLLTGPRSSSAGDLAVHADVVVFPLPEGKQATHLYFLATPGEESPVSRPEGEAGKFLARFELRREGGEAPEVWQRVFSWGDSAEGGAAVWQYRLVRDLAPGRYEGWLEVEDLERDGKGRVELGFLVPDPEEGPSVSGLFLGICGTEEQGGGEGTVMPWPSHVFDAEHQIPCALLRWEGTADGEVRVRYAVRDAEGRTRKEGTRELHSAAKEVLVRLDLDGLPQGRYRLRVDLEEGEIRIRREVEFEVEGGRIEMSGNALQLRTVLSYIATGEELLQLERTDDGSLQFFWEGFWARRDQRPETAANEAQAEFLRRVEYAIRHLGDMNPGWDTDRGEMYIRYGDPDRMETVPGGAGRLPTQIWYYYERNLTLVFQDVDGSGRYRQAANRRR